MTKRRVLMIDDDMWLAEQFERTLTRHGFAVTRAADGLAGMAAIDTARPDVILLDLFMPGPNGLVLLHELQSHSDLATIPVIMCSNNGSDTSLATLAPYGVRVLLDKTTMLPDDIVTAVRKVLP